MSLSGRRGAGPGGAPTHAERPVFCERYSVLPPVRVRWYCPSSVSLIDVEKSPNRA